jgi:hypothetical protein
MSAYWQSEQDHPFIVLSERLPDSHSPSTSPFFVRTIESAIGNVIEDSFSSSNPLSARDILKRDAGLDTNIAGVVIPFLVGVVQIGFQAKGNHIAMVSLQLAQAVATSGQAHRVVDAVGARGRTAAGVVGTTASGIARVGTNNLVNGVSALQQRAGGACRRALSFPSLPDRFVTLNPFNRSRSPHTDAQNTDGVEDDIEDDIEDGFEHPLTDDIFMVGSDSEDEVDSLDGIQIEENPWAGERGFQTRDNFQEIVV